VSTFPKSAVEQTVEIESLVSEALEVLDHIRYSLKTLEDRLKAAQAQAAARAQARSSAAPADAPPADAPPADAPPADAPPADAPPADGAV
jgi:hypothetical protein